jgi:ABC-type antimicrobial peptide transport system permease subunit
MGALMNSVRVRTREIAIRIAIGADPSTVRKAVVRQSLATVGVGILLGTALGAAGGALIVHQLFRVHPLDVSTVIAVASALMALGWLAAVVPARTASRVEPATALRQV